MFGPLSANWPLSVYGKDLEEAADGIQKITKQSSASLL